MGNKYMTLEDLYNFCLKNNFNHFSYIESGDELSVCLPSELFSKEITSDKHKEGLTPFESKAFHDNVNLNNSSIPEKSFKENSKSAVFRPVLANIITNKETGEKDFGSHDFTVSKDENGENVFVYEEKPVGVICDNLKIEYDSTAKVNRLICNGYLFNGYCQDAIDILNRRGTVSCSVELTIREMSFDSKKKVLSLDDYYVTGLTLLGEDIKPGMAGSDFKIADFSASETSVFEKYNTEEKLIETLDKLNETLKTFNINNEERRNEAMDNKELESVVEEVVEETNEASEEVIVTEEEIKSEETVVEAPSEELEEIFEESNKEDAVEEQFEEESDDEIDEVTDENTEEDIAPLDLTEDEEDDEVHSESESETESEIGLPDDDDIKKITHSVSVGEVTKEFSVSLNDVIFALTTLVNDTYGETDCDWYSVNVFDTEKYVEMYGWNKAYRQAYKVKGGNYSLVGDRVEVFAKYLTQDEIHQLENMKANYSSIESELNSYKEKELDTEKMNVFNEEKYENIKGTKQFEELIENRKNYSIDEIRTEADKMLEFAKSLFSFSKEEKKATKVVSMFSNDDREEKKKHPYGNLFKNLKK